MNTLLRPSAVQNHRSIIGTVEGWLDDGLRAIANSSAILEQKLNIPEWYALNARGSCEGTFSPNASSTTAKLHATNCSNTILNVTKILDHATHLVPGNVKLPGLSLFRDIDDRLQHISRVTYLTHIFLLGISILALVSPAILFCYGSHHKILWCILIINLITAIYATLLRNYVNSKAIKVSGGINEMGHGFGVSAQIGREFAVMGWVSMAFSWCVVLYWALCLVVVKIGG